jgi:hypothetical protein
MAFVVTATHPITLPGGRMAAPGEEVKNVKASDPQIVALVEAGSLHKKRTEKAKSVEPAETVEAPALPETETEKN